MKALVLHTPGPEARLVPTDVESPSAGPGEVVVEVAAIGVNPVDFKVCDYEAACEMICGTKGPLVIGWDIAGTVVEAGEAASFAVGDRVFGMVNFPGGGDGYAERVRAPSTHLTAIPDGTSFEDAAATTLAALTAIQVLRGRLEEGQRVLVHAGSGGVGHYAIQLAKALGAYVITTCSAKNRDFVLGLGADEHIDYRTTNFADVVSDVDLVIDALGGDNTEACVSVTKSGGHVVVLPGPAGEEEVAAAAARGVTLEFVLVTSSGEDMKLLADHLAAGRLRAHVSQTFPFAEMGGAHDALRSGRVVGKVVVTV